MPSLSAKVSRSARLPDVLGLLAAIVATGCQARGLSDSPYPSGAAGTTGAAGTSWAAGTTGVGGTTGGGGWAVGGTTGAAPAPPVCKTLSAAVGVANHCGRMVGVAYSPDGRMLAAGAETGAPNVHLWNLETGSLIRDLDGIGRVTYSVAFSPDGKLLASAGQASDDLNDAATPGIVKLWDVATGALVSTIPATCGGYADSVVFSHDGSLLATAGYHGPVEIWRVADGARVASIPYPTSVHNVHFGLDDSQLVVAGVDERVTVWTVPEATLVLTLSGTADEQADGAFSPNGRLIATTGLGNAIKIWDAASGSLLQALMGHQAYVSHVLWIDDSRVVSDDWSGNVRMWQADGAGVFAAGPVWSVGNQALGIALSPDKTGIAVGEGDGILFLAVP